MGPLDEFIRQAGAKAVKQGSLTLIDRDAAISVLDICASKGVRVLGVEGFSVSDGKVIPMMDAIGDFSTASSASQSVRDAREFFHSTALAALMFELELQPAPGSAG